MFDKNMLEALEIWCWRKIDRKESKQKIVFDLVQEK